MARAYEKQSRRIGPKFATGGEAVWQKDLEHYEQIWQKDSEK